MVHIIYFDRALITGALPEIYYTYGCQVRVAWLRLDSRVAMDHSKDRVNSAILASISASDSPLSLSNSR